MAVSRLPWIWCRMTDIKDQSRAGVVIRKFMSLYGTQKVGAMWHGADIVEVKQDWNNQLGRFNGPTIAAALQAVVESGREWPPTLPEFVRICRDYNRLEKQTVAQALPAPGAGHTDAETAKARIRALLDSLAAAKRV